MHPVVALNAVNLTTAAGWLTASAAGCRIVRRDRCWEATGYRWRFPFAGAFTIGCVVISRQRVPEAVWEHEMAHVRQYAILGWLFVPAYLAASGYSLVRTGDWWSRNVFERAAGLSAGGYREHPARAFIWSGRRRPGATAAGAVTA
ncbi:MAG: hypothetical protein R2720_05465 [Candidatus Nanopelagicales bacterium]